MSAVTSASISSWTNDPHCLTQQIPVGQLILAPDVQKGHACFSHRVAPFQFGSGHPLWKARGGSLCQATPIDTTSGDATRGRAPPSVVYGLALISPRQKWQGR